MRIFDKCVVFFQKSPFHFSPIKSPPEIRVQQPAETPSVAPPQLHTTRLRTEKVTVRERGPAPKGLLVPPSGGGHLTPHLEEPGAHDITPDQTMRAKSPAAPKQDKTMPGTRPKHSKLEIGGKGTADVKRGRGFAPKDTWGGYG